MAKKQNKPNDEESRDLDLKLQQIMDQAKSETEALKKMLKALDERTSMEPNKRIKDLKKNKK